MLKAILFDQDGVIVETEKDGHRVAFNTAFKEFRIPVEWDVPTYQKLLKIGGGKERLRYFFDNDSRGLSVKQGDMKEMIENLHVRKTEIFVELIQTGRLPLRPGILRLMNEANERGVVVCICTTSNEKAADEDLSVCYQR